MRRDWCSPRTPFRSPPTSAAAPACIAAKSPMRQGLSPPRPVTPIRRGVAVTVGPPQVPWLEPDVADHLNTLAQPDATAGAEAVVVCPIGFVADHIEVVWDLDHELRTSRGGGHSVRAGPHAQRRPAVARLAVDLMAELRDVREPARVIGPDAVPGCGASINGEPCHPPHCVAEYRPG